MPKVSVIIPAYNQAQYLGEAIQSVLDQTFRDFEIIVVDDGSIDNTKMVVEDFTHPRLEYIYQENQGLAGARNTGIQLSSAAYLSFLDSDDILLPDNLRLLVDVLDRKPNVCMAFGQSEIIDERGYPTGKIFDKPLPNDLPLLLLNNPIQAGTILIKRSCLEKAGYFNECLKACEDWDLWLRLALDGCNFYNLHKLVLQYRFHQSQMTRDPKRMLTASIAMLDNIFSQPNLTQNWLTYKNQAFSRAYMRAAAQSYRAELIDAAKSYIREAIKFDPDLLSKKGEQLASLISGWANDPRTNNALNFLETVYENLPEDVIVLEDSKQGRLANTAAMLAFTAYNGHEYSAVRRHVWYAIRHDPKLIFNRGLISIFMRSIVQS